MKLADLDTALAAALAPLVPTLVKKVVVASDQVAGADLADLVQRLGLPAPWVLCIYGGGPMDEVNAAGGIYWHRPTYSVLFGVNKLRDNASARAGLYPLLAEVMSLLNHQTFSLAIEPVRIGPEVRLVDMLPQVLVYGVDVQTGFEWNISEEAA